MGGGERRGVKAVGGKKKKRYPCPPSNRGLTMKRSHNGHAEPLAHLRALNCLGSELLWLCILYCFHGLFFSFNFLPADSSFKTPNPTGWWLLPI